MITMVLAGNLPNLSQPFNSLSALLRLMNLRDEILAGNMGNVDLVAHPGADH
jgi:hypothetical protein